MYIDKIINKLSPSLILCLAGWSTSPELFRHLEVPEQTDLWIAYDYRTLAFEEAFAPYKEVHLVAWSLGVWVATRLWAGHRSFTTATALNGTPFPMHDTLGIPTAIFEGTLHHISEEGMRRFNRRMCGDKETFNRYSELSPRPLEEIKEELESLYNQILPESSNQPIHGYPPSGIKPSYPPKIRYSRQPTSGTTGKAVAPSKRSRRLIFLFTTINHGTNYGSNRTRTDPPAFQPSGEYIRRSRGCPETDMRPSGTAIDRIHLLSFPQGAGNRLRKRRIHPFIKTRMPNRGMGTQRSLRDLAKRHRGVVSFRHSSILGR